MAVAGDVIIVHGGIYREWVRPLRGGVSDDQRIIYRAAPGEKAVIKGSEVIRGWKRFQGNVWKVTLPDTFFGDFNPYKEVLHGDWFNGRGRVHHAGAEIAGIKLHGAIDVVIRHNRIHNTGRGIWLDWMAQGTRVTGNLLYDNTEEDVFVEVNHGSFLVDNNLFLSGKSMRNWSEGAAFVHNLLAGYIEAHEERNRFTPYMFPHSTQVAGLRNTWNGQERFYNNIMVGPGTGKNLKVPANSRYMRKGWGLCVYDSLDFRILAAGNVYLNGTRPYRLERDYLLLPGFDPDIRFEEEGEHVYLSLTLPEEIRKQDTPFITTAFLGRTKNTRLLFEDPDGVPIKIDRDYFGHERNKEHPVPGPFGDIGKDSVKLKVW